MSIAFEKSFASFDGQTPLGKKKVDCWAVRNPLKPREVCKCSGKKYWFDCDRCSHEFENDLRNITYNQWCPYCANPCKKICSEDILCYHCYNNSFVSVDSLTPSGNLKTDYWGDRNPLNPHEVCKTSNKKYWFNCDKCSHEFESVLSSITNGTWCPYCANQKLCNNISCNDCFEKSFASFEYLTILGKKKVECWSDRNKLKPHEVCKSSNKKFWFNCDKCSHEFESSLSHITCRNQWCPYCANQKLCSEDILCYHCYSKSFASFDSLTPSGNLKRDYWTSKNPLNPREVTKGSNKKYWFECDKCGHEFESALSSITNGTWCPYCCTNGTVCGNISCEDCFEKSFASFEGITPSGNLKVDCWSDRNELKPYEVTKCSNQKFWFDCDKCGHKFESVLYHITKGSWCPNCRNKTELKLYNWLLEKDYINSVQREWCPIWCSTEYTHFVKTKYKIGRYQYRFDFLVTLKNKKQIIIELDGRQHYERVRDWKTPIEQQIRDKYKEFKAKKNGLSIIRCYQADVYMDRNEWEHTLCNVLSSLL
mgnify:CR=1 FL=1|tara:strand:- start:5768 stop:7378 length:1611 start_codon:yes stop_codon:yes gene_type:complete